MQAHSWAGMRVTLPSRRTDFNVIRERQAIETIMKELPDKEVIKLISFGVFSAIGIIAFVADRVTVDRMVVSSLAVGAKHAQVLDVLANQGKLKHCEFFIGSVMRMDAKKKALHKPGMKDRSQVLDDVCTKRGWERTYCKNHSKVILMDSAEGQFVVETSSNLNENPKFEQFSFEKNPELFQFYDVFFQGLKDTPS